MTRWAEEHARTSDPVTSHQAAELVTTRMSMMANLERVFMRSPDGLTSDEASRMAGYMPVHGAWKRVSDLIRDGIVVDTGRTRAGFSNRQQRVLTWVPPEARDTPQEPPEAGGMQ